MTVKGGHAGRCPVKRGPLTFSLPRKPSSEQNRWKWTRKQDVRIPCLMESKSLQLLASPVLPRFLLRDGSALHKPKHTRRANTCESAAGSVDHCEQPGWKGSPRADGCTLALGVQAGGEGNWVGISSTELEKAGKKQEILAEPSPVAWLPEKESISQGSGGIRGAFQQLALTAGSPYFAICEVAQ